MNLLVAFAVFPAYLVASFFIKHDPGPVEPKREIHRSVSFGVLSIILAIILSTAFSVALTGEAEVGFGEVASDASIPFVFFIFAFAAIEEITKFIPIAIYLKRKPFFNEHTDGIIYFSIVGLTFGAIENFLYGLGAGDAGLGLILARLVIALFFHGALTSIAGYFYARAHIRRQGLVVPVLALICVSVAHTFYNFFAFSIQDNPAYIFGAAVIAILANSLMFWLYFVASANDTSLGLAGPQFKQQPAVAGPPQNTIEPKGQ